IRIVGEAQAGSARYRAVATVTDAQKAAFNGLATPPPVLSQSVAVGISPPPSFTLRTDMPEIVFGKDLSATVKVSVARVGDFAEQIALAVQVPTPAQPPAAGLPVGVTAAVKPIAKGQNDVEIVFSATTQAPLGKFSVVLAGTGKKGNETVVQPI